MPRGWKPSAAAPVTVIRCVYRWPDLYPDGNPHPRAGERCGRWSLRGYTQCYKHSGNGNFENVDKYREAVVESARLRLVGNLDDATDVLEDLMHNSTSDAVRLKAVELVYDRTGLRGGFEVDVQVDDKRDPSDVLRDRINTLRQRTIEGELVRRADEALVAQALETATNEEVSVTVEPDEVPNMEDS